MGTEKPNPPRGHTEGLQTLTPRQIDVLGGLVADQIFALCIQPRGVVATRKERAAWRDTFRAALYRLVEARLPITSANLNALLFEELKPSAGVA